MAPWKVRGSEFKHLLGRKNASACTEPAHSPVGPGKSVSRKAAGSKGIYITGLQIHQREFTQSFSRKEKISDENFRA